MKKIIALVLMVVMALGTAACGGGEKKAADTKAAAPAATGSKGYGTYKWKAAMTVAETTTNYKMVKKFADLIHEKSGGSITVDVYPAGQLGSDFAEAVVGGSIEMGTGINVDLVDFVPEMSLFDIPNLFTDVKQMRGLLNSDYSKTLNDYCSKAGIHMLAYSDAGFRQLTTNKKINRIAEIKGQKIRTMTDKYHVAYWNELGATATPIQFTELFMALQQHTIDGEENPYMNIVGNNLQEVQKYVYETNHIGHIITFFMNNKLYTSLPEKDRKLVDECAAEASKFAAGIADESIKADKKKCTDAGCEISTLNKEDQDWLKSKAKPVEQMVRKDLGDAKVDGLLKALAKVK